VAIFVKKVKNCVVFNNAGLKKYCNLLFKRYLQKGPYGVKQAMIEKKEFNRQQGVTLLETLVVLALLGMVLAWSFPSILNTLETRNLENTAREILTIFQRAKYLAVEEKAPYRVRMTTDRGSM